ncbi:unnamed protein product [Gadus morhua 'NCC']
MDEFRASVGLSVGFPAADTLEETSDSGGSLASSWPLRAPEDAQCERRGTPTLPYPTLLPSEELLRGTGAPYRPGAALTSTPGTGLDQGWTHRDPSSDRPLDPVWTGAGPGLDPGWTQSGPGLDRGWTKDGPRLDPGWSRAGPSLDRGWTGAGPRLDPGWTQA